jgi:hypothetical protein
MAHPETRPISYPPQLVSLLGTALNLSPNVLVAEATLEPTLFQYKYPNTLKSSHSSFLPAHEDGTDRVLQNVGI